MNLINTGDIFLLPHGEQEAMTVTTNGIIKTNGLAVMGRGIAKAVDDRYHVSGKLARHLQTCGNIPCDLGIYDGFHVLSFPTKYHWQDDSDIDLIIRSARGLVGIADNLHLKRVFMTPPGCANGHLDWENLVKPAIKDIFDDRFWVVETYTKDFIPEDFRLIDDMCNSLSKDDATSIELNVPTVSEKIIISEMSL